MVQGQEHRSLLCPNAAFDVVAIATSAGGLRALGRVVANLPEDFPAAIAIVQHLAPKTPSLLVNILSRQTLLPVKPTIAGERLRSGVIHVALPDRHLLIDPDGTIVLSHSEKIHFVRPSADCLFESVAYSFKERAVAVVLTGTGSDGADGVQTVKRLGGFTIAQDRATSEFFGMPGAAIQTQAIDLVLPLPQIAPTLVKLVKSGRGKFSD